MYQQWRGHNQFQNRECKSRAIFLPTTPCHHPTMFLFLLRVIQHQRRRQLKPLKPWTSVTRAYSKRRNMVEQLGFGLTKVTSTSTNNISCGIFTANNAWDRNDWALWMRIAKWIWSKHPELSKPSCLYHIHLKMSWKHRGIWHYHRIATRRSYQHKTNQ